MMKRLLWILLLLPLLAHGAAEYTINWIPTPPDNEGLEPSDKLYTMPDDHYEIWYKTRDGDVWRKHGATEETSYTMTVQFCVRAVTETGIRSDCPDTPIIEPPEFSCEPRKTCGAMASCEEAMYHLNVCGNSRLDGNDDGVPCQTGVCR